jgi:hypothetical protein
MYHETSTQIAGSRENKNEKQVPVSMDWKQMSQLSVQHMCFIFWRSQCQSQLGNLLFCLRVL